MKLEPFPQDIINEYNVTSKVDHNRNVHSEVQRGTYGLPQAGIIARELLKDRLKKQATHRANSHQATGSTNGAPSVSHLLWTTLVLSALEKNTP